MSIKTINSVLKLLRQQQTPKTKQKQATTTSDEQHYHPIMVELLRYQLFLASTVLFLQVWRTSLANIDHLKS
jgi:hypothetical protein